MPKFFGSRGGQADLGRIREALSPASVDIAVRALTKWRRPGCAKTNIGAKRALGRLRMPTEHLSSLTWSSRTTVWWQATWRRATKRRLRKSNGLRKSSNASGAEVPPQLSDCERHRVRVAAAGISALWTTLSAKEQAEIVRLMIERVTAMVVDDSERLEVGILWHGGCHSQFEARRPVRHFWQLSDYAELRERALELLGQGMGKADVAATLNAEGKKTARSNQFTSQSVKALLSPRQQGAEETASRADRPQAGRMADRRALGSVGGAKVNGLHLGFERPIIRAAGIEPAQQNLPALAHLRRQGRAEGNNTVA